MRTTLALQHARLEIGQRVASAQADRASPGESWLDRLLCETWTWIACRDRAEPNSNPNSYGEAVDRELVIDGRRGARASLGRGTLLAAWQFIDLRGSPVRRPRLAKGAVAAIIG
jgi:hypothetical protein